jgi:hypothetical protein
MYTTPFTNGESASLVIGQSGFTSKSFANPPTASSLSVPTGLAFDGAGNLWVADSSYNRVLKFTGPFTNGESASLVIGQSGFTSNGSPTTPTASSLNKPSAVVFDSSVNPWITDNANNRVLKYTHS